MPREEEKGSQRNLMSGPQAVAEFARERLGELDTYSLPFSLVPCSPLLPSHPPPVSL